MIAIVWTWWINSEYNSNHTRTCAITGLSKLTDSPSRELIARILSYSFSWNVTVLTLSKTPSRWAWIVCESLAWPKISSKAGSDTKKKRGNTRRFFSRYLCIVKRNTYHQHAVNWITTVNLHDWWLWSCCQKKPPFEIKLIKSLLAYLRKGKFLAWFRIDHFRFFGTGLEPACNWNQCGESFQM